MIHIYPTLWSIDLLNVQKELEKVDEIAHGYQLDVMDNHFVPNLTYGADFVNAVARITYKKIWVHLMVDRPEALIDALVMPHGSIVTFHFESNGEKTKTISRIEGKLWMPSIAINPKTPPEEIFYLLPSVYQVLVMSVEPGRSGQEFIKSSIDKIRLLVGYRQTSGLKFRIAIDGGVNANNIVDLVSAGVDDFAIASAIFGSQDPAATLRKISALVCNAV